MALLVLVGFASVAYADGTVTDVKVVGGSKFQPAALCSIALKHLPSRKIKSS